LSRVVAINRPDGQLVQSEKDTLESRQVERTLSTNAKPPTTPPATSCTEFNKLSYTPEDSSIDTSCPSLAEVHTAIRGLRSGRAAGPNNISPEMLKAALDAVSFSLHALIKRLSKTGLVPSE